MGFSPGKLLVFVLFVTVLWVGFRFANRVDAIRRSVREEVKRRQQQTQRPPSLKAEDLVKCAACSTYVSASSAVACGRADCPWRR
jgi:hypothetical protein